MLGFTIVLLAAVGVLGLLFAGRRRRARRQLHVVPDSPSRGKPRPRLRVWRGKLDRKSLYYDPKQFRRRRR
ncbi:hypothetical protein [Acidihalobacter prosperus]